MSQPATDDAAIIERSWAEPAWFAPVFDRHAAHIHRYAARRVGRQVGDDVVAETFLVAFERRRRYDLGRMDARPWLYGIATNLIRKHWRTELHVRVPRHGPHRPTAARRHAGPQRRAARGRRRRGRPATLSRRAVDPLSDNDRVWFRLVRW